MQSKDVNNLKWPHIGTILAGGQSKRIPDHKPDSGPLGGIETLLSSNLDTEYLVVACDQPLLTVELLQKLAKSTPSSNIRLFTFESFSDINPFPGIYPSSLLPHIK